VSVHITEYNWYRIQHRIVLIISTLILQTVGIAQIIVYWTRENNKLA